MRCATDLAGDRRERLDVGVVGSDHFGRRIGTGDGAAVHGPVGLEGRQQREAGEPIEPQRPRVVGAGDHPVRAIAIGEGRPHQRPAGAGALDAGLDGQQRQAPQALTLDRLGDPDQLAVVCRDEAPVGVGLQRVADALLPSPPLGLEADIELERRCRGPGRGRNIRSLHLLDLQCHLL